MMSKAAFPPLNPAARTALLNEIIALRSTARAAAGLAAALEVFVAEPTEENSENAIAPQNDFDTSVARAENFRDAFFLAC